MASSGVDQGNLGTLALVEHISCLCYTCRRGSESGKGLECVAKMDTTAQGARALQIVPEKTKSGVRARRWQDGSTLVTSP